MKLIVPLLVLTDAIGLAVLSIVCVFNLRDESALRVERSDFRRAIVVMHPTADSDASGVIEFRSSNGVMQITGEIKGLSPGLHGFHIHEYGDISSKDGSSAGGHFNPTDRPHGGPESAHHSRHVGDLGNIRADSDGRAVIRATDKVIALEGPHSIVGRAVVVHAGSDDLKSQPSGDAGKRVACGVIGIANPSPETK